jgi:dinuclear metal center YbgI/SA1388 family protein
MKVRDVISLFEDEAPFSWQEPYDNSGLQAGDPEAVISSVLVCIDVTEDVIDEALSLHANLIISHHPVLFGELKSLTGKTGPERVLIRAIKNNISILSVHTNYDSSMQGVNRKIAEMLGLKDIRILQPQKDSLLKLVFFVPTDHLEKVRMSIFKAGAGVIGAYDMCSFNSEGSGTFRASEHTNPFAGKRGEFHTEKETRVETILPANLQDKVVSALIDAHPYEEVAYDIYPLRNRFEGAGMGMTGILDPSMDESGFLEWIKELFHCGCVRHSALLGRKISKVAVCGGSGSFLLKSAIEAEADVFVTGDFKYHQFFGAGKKIMIADIGHYESEQFTKELFHEALTKKISTFAVHLSKVNTNPINYL